MVYTKNQRVSASMSCSDECLSTFGIFQIIEDSLTELTGELKIDGIIEKEKYNAFWVFTKTRVKIFKKFKWNEEFSVACFISSKSLAKIYFDVVAKNLKNELAFYARVEACALDYSSQRIRKLTTVGVDEQMLAETPPMEVEFCKFDYANLPTIEQVKVRSTNIDMSHHTNNLEYLRFILNTYSVKELEQRKIAEIEIIYASQSFENDLLNVKKLATNNKDVIVLEKEDKPVVKCEILFC